MNAKRWPLQQRRAAPRSRTFASARARAHTRTCTHVQSKRETPLRFDLVGVRSAEDKDLLDASRRQKLERVGERRRVGDRHEATRSFEGDWSEAFVVRVGENQRLKRLFDARHHRRVLHTNEAAC